MRQLRSVIGDHRYAAIVRASEVVLQALAFSLIRQGRKSEAMALLERAAGSGGSAEPSYLFGLALIDDGQQKRGIHILEKSTREHARRSRSAARVGIAGTGERRE